jgi:hypothetical protein
MGALGILMITRRFDNEVVAREEAKDMPLGRRLSLVIAVLCSDSMRPVDNTEQVRGFQGMLVVHRLCRINQCLSDSEEG